MRYYGMGFRDVPTVPYYKRHLPGFTFVEDHGKGAVETWLRMLRTIEDGPAISIEDDVILTRNFVVKSSLAIAEHPDVLIQMHSRTKEDKERGSRWRAALSFYNNQCLYYPPGYIPGLLEWCASSDGVALFERDPTGYDRAMAFYMQATGQRYWNLVPSLAEHLPTTSNINPRRSRYRYSTTFVDPETEGHPYPETPRP